MSKNLQIVLAFVGLGIFLVFGAWYVNSTISSDLLRSVNPAGLQTSQLFSNGELPVLGPTLPELTGGDGWINSDALTSADLKGKVVLIDFWTYSCINCLRTLPHIKEINSTYGPDGLVVIGVHTPEFAFEKVPANVQKAVKDLGVTYPVVLDGEYNIWQAINSTSAWPAQFLYDGQGRLRYVHAGEGSEANLEAAIKSLTGSKASVSGSSSVDFSQIKSPETYFGYDRVSGYAGKTSFIKNSNATYSRSDSLPGLNSWDLSGLWNDQATYVESAAADAHLRFTFSAPIANFVLSGLNGQQVKVHVLLDGQDVSSTQAGSDLVDSVATIGDARLYQLVKNLTGKHTIELIPEGAGLQVFTITFG